MEEPNGYDSDEKKANTISRKEFSKRLMMGLGGIPLLTNRFFRKSGDLSSSGADNRPNIVFITTDQQMADAMSFRMGNKWIHTPNMDRLASRGVFFTRAYAANPLCAPSRNSIVTGRFPHTTGIEKNGDLAIWGNWNKPPESLNYWTGENFKSMGTYFKDAGYETAHFGKWHINYNPADKAVHGFETVRHPTKPINDISVPYEADKFLKRPHKKPFMLWASFINPHDICQVARFQKLPEGPIGKLPPVSKLPPLKSNLAPPRNETEAMALIRKSYNKTKQFPVGHYSHFDWRRLRWSYYRLVEKVDAQIGKLLTSLKSNGYDKNTLIVFTSDHGTLLGAHGFNQKTMFYEESARVPLIISYPGKITPGLNKTLVNTGIDLLPTLLDFAHIKKLSILPGISLKKAAEDHTPLTSRRYIVCENEMMQGGPVHGKTPDVSGRMVRGKRYKYCLYDTLNHREALFDEKKDPGETVNIAYKKPSKPIIKKYRSYLNEFARKYRDEKGLNMIKYVINK
jgi:choline-sulfatase